MPLRLEDKMALVAEVNQVAASAFSAIAAEYRGLSVSQMTELRAKAREESVYVRVVKNTLAKRAVAGTEFEWDILDDLKLNPGNGNVFAKVTGGATWSSEPYNPFNSTLEVELLYHDNEGVLKLFKDTYNPMELTFVDIGEIKYFDILDTDKPITNYA